MNDPDPRSLSRAEARKIRRMMIAVGVPEQPSTVVMVEMLCEAFCARGLYFELIAKAMCMGGEKPAIVTDKIYRKAFPGKPPLWP